MRVRARTCVRVYVHFECVLSRDLKIGVDSVLQCIAVCCSVLRCVAVCCRVLQCAAGSKLT